MLTQSRLETYLASSSHIDLDIARHNNRSPSRSKSPLNGAETPRDLTSRIKIVELFTLHVLPRNEEWEYARSFISMSDILDDERREAFLQSLQELQDVKENDVREQQTALQQERDAQLQAELGEKNRTEAETAGSQRRASEQGASTHRRTSSEVDYGIEKSRPNGNAAAAPKLQKPDSRSGATNGAGHTQFSPPSETSRNRKIRQPSKTQSAAYLSHAKNLFRALQNLVRNMASSIGANPTLLLKLLLSVLAIIMAFSRRDIRERARRILDKGWDKVRSTVGMGVKVSYI
jgi:hypothetical protein